MIIYLIYGGHSNRKRSLSRDKKSGWDSFRDGSTLIQAAGIF